MQAADRRTPRNTIPETALNRRGNRGGLNLKAWHGDQPYDEKEIVRLVKACEHIRKDSERLTSSLGRRYDLLDIGCGVGPLRRWLAVSEFRIVGLDLSEEAVTEAARHYDLCEVGDVEEPWAFEPESFDGVHAGAVMEHVLDWHRPLNEANRVLRDAGLLVVSVPNLRYWKEIRRLLRGRQPHWLRSMHHVHAYTRDFLCTLLSIHGFKVETVEADRVNLPGLPRRNRWLERRFAGLGSVLIVEARLSRRVRVEDRSRSDEFTSHKPVELRSIEIIP